MRATILLSDFAQVADGKLYIIGGGWSVAKAPLVPCSLAIKIELAWIETESSHSWNISLLDEDGLLVSVETPEGSKNFSLEGTFNATKPEGLPPGSPVDVALALNFGPLPLAGGKRYVWRLSIDGFSNPEWEVSFFVKNP